MQSKKSGGAPIKDWIQRDTTGGILLLLAAVIALVWANSPWSATYHALNEAVIGPRSWHLDLSLGDWAADGLLAIFFFVVGLELKQEFVSGSLRRPRQAAVPVIAAVGGMVLPAAIFVSTVVIAGDRSALGGWAIPTATDIAFAVAVLAVFGKGLPRALRVFLLTLAVVDDLLAILIIAFFYASNLNIIALAGALMAVVLFGWLVRRRRLHWYALIPIALAAWVLMHVSGVHATIAGVALGVVVPAGPLYGEPTNRAHRIEELVRPFSSALALPIFAFFAAGVTVLGGGAQNPLVQPVAIAVMVGLCVGKVVGVLGTTALVTTLSSLRLPGSLDLVDLVPVGFLTGIGFTVSLLIAGLAFPDGAHTTSAKIAVLVGSLISGIIGAVMLRWNARRATKPHEQG